jgi:NAD(P)-dependent dehydrogenase (short-subunit alcohol dehydrogenase family)
MNVVFLGATRGIGRALARLLAARGDRLFLLGRDLDELARSGADLDARSKSGSACAGVARCDLLAPDGFDAALEAAWSAFGRVDAVVVTAGLFATQEALEADRGLARRLLEADFSGTVLFCEAARARLLAAGGGTLSVFSSVAGERGRKPVVLYGAAKAGLTRYLEGLDHRFRARGLRVVTVKPGFVKTAMTDGLPVPPFAGEAEPVARRVLAALDRGTPVVYAPAIWRFVMLVVRNLPRALLRRLEF